MRTRTSAHLQSSACGGTRASPPAAPWRASVDDDLVRDRAPRAGHAVGVHRACADRVRPGAVAQPAERGAPRPAPASGVRRASRRGAGPRRSARPPRRSSGPGSRRRPGAPSPPSQAAAAAPQADPRARARRRQCDTFVRCPDGLASRLCTAARRSDSTRSRHLRVPSPSAPDAIASCSPDSSSAAVSSTASVAGTSTRTVVPGRSPRSSVPSIDTSASREERFTKPQHARAAVGAGIEEGHPVHRARPRRRRVHGPPGSRPPRARRRAPRRGRTASAATCPCRHRCVPTGPSPGCRAPRSSESKCAVRPRAERQPQRVVARVGVVVGQDRGRAAARRAVDRTHQALPPERVRRRREQVHVPQVLPVRRRPCRTGSPGGPPGSTAGSWPRGRLSDSTARRHLPAPSPRPVLRRSAGEARPGLELRGVDHAGGSGRQRQDHRGNPATSPASSTPVTVASASSSPGFTSRKVAYLVRRCSPG